jgi:hypothetical protein
MHSNNILGGAPSDDGAFDWTICRLHGVPADCIRELEYIPNCVNVLTVSYFVCGNDRHAVFVRHIEDGAPEFSYIGDATEHPELLNRL